MDFSLPKSRSATKISNLTASLYSSMLVLHKSLHSLLTMIHVHVTVAIKNMISTVTPGNSIIVSEFMVIFPMSKKFSC